MRLLFRHFMAFCAFALFMASMGNHDQIFALIGIGLAILSLENAL